MAPYHCGTCMPHLFGNPFDINTCGQQLTGIGMSKLRWPSVGNARSGTKRLKKILSEFIDAGVLTSLIRIIG